MLTLVSAPAGTGKTATVSAWAFGLPEGVLFWLTVDQRVADLGAVLEVLSDRIDASARQTDFSAVVLDCDRPLRPGEAEAVDALLRAGGESLRLVLLTRSDPLLPLQRYRLADALVELRAHDLAFTTDETAELLSGRGLDLPADAVDALTRRTRGWIAGLLLSAMTLPHAEDPLAAVRALAGDHGPVAEYLLREMLDKQPPGLRDVLLKSSVLDVLSADLVSEVLDSGVGGRTLTFLTHDNVLIEPSTEEPGSYEYHPLFADLLRAELAFEAPEAFRTLHRRAARSMTARGRTAEAVQHYLSAGAWDEATHCYIDDLAVMEVVEGAPIVGAPTDVTTQLPNDLRTPAAELIRAALALRAGDIADSAASLTRAGRLLVRDPAGPWPTGELTLHLLRALHARVVGDAPVLTAEVTETEKRLDMMDPSRVRHRPSLPATLENARGVALTAQGDLQGATEAFAAAASAMEASARTSEAHRPPPPPDELVESLGHLALIAAWQGQLRRASALAQRALTIRVSGGQRRESPSVTGRLAAQTALEWVAVERQIPAEAPATPGQASLSQGRVGSDALRVVMAAIAHARARRMLHDFRGARAALDDLEDREGVPDWLGDRVRVEIATLALLAGRADEAVEVVGRFRRPPDLEAAVVRDKTALTRGYPPEAITATSAEPSGPAPSRIEFWLLQAWRKARSGEQALALRALERSLKIAAPEQLKRPFREAPEEVRHLLQSDQVMTRHDWVLDDRRQGPAIPRQRRESEALRSPEPLTTKEREVLQHLDSLLTTEEIADAMFISVNTVRTHVRNILRKLSASRRNEAVRRAREIGLLSPLRSPKRRPQTE
jgi:LuxR family maltose regulon positive regulatory protein